MLILVGIIFIAQQERVSAFWQSRDSNYNVAISSGGTPQVTFDAKANGSSNGSNVNQITWSHTVVGTPTDIVVAIANYEGNASVTSVLYGASNMTIAGTKVVTPGNSGMYLYCLASPPSGNQTVTVNYNITNGIFMQGESISVTQGNLTTPCRTQGSNTGTSSSSTTVSATSQVDDLVIDVIGADSVAPSSAGGGQTIALNYNGGAGFGTGVGVSYKNGAASSTTMTWSLASNANWGALAVAIEHQ